MKNLKNQHTASNPTLYPANVVHSLLSASARAFCAVLNLHPNFRHDKAGEILVSTFHDEKTAKNFSPDEEMMFDELKKHFENRLKTYYLPPKE